MNIFKFFKKQIKEPIVTDLIKAKIEEWENTPALFFKQVSVIYVDNTKFNTLYWDLNLVDTDKDGFLVFGKRLIIVNCKDYIAVG